MDVSGFSRAVMVDRPFNGSLNVIILVSHDSLEDASADLVIISTCTTLTLSHRQVVSYQV